MNYHNYTILLESIESFCRRPSQLFAGLIPNYLKIKGSFIRDAKNDRSKWIFVKMMNDIARRLKIKSIAKYVEFETTLGKLREIGVDFAQGCSFGEPAPPPGLAASQ
jgi:EAL domain-containing protein (putative c-di-GMP-specific phosphodiesterase class I)